jgi:hypothetical protein
METYRHSGSISYSGILIASAAGIAAAVVLGIIYSFAIVHIPFAKLHFVLTMFYGALIGLAVGWGAKIGKIRSVFIAATYGFACGLVGLYVAWAVDLIARVIIPDNGVWPMDYLLAFSPDVLLDYIKQFYEHGAWGMRGGEILKGPFLGVIWAAEAIVIVGGATFFAPMRIKDHPFCETCKHWTTIKPVGTKLSLRDVERTLPALLSGDVTALSDFSAADTEQLYLELELASCPTCDESHYLSVFQVAMTIDKKGKETVERRPVIRNMLIAAEDVPLARNAGMKRQEPTDGEV